MDLNKLSKDRVNTEAPGKFRDSPNYLRLRNPKLAKYLRAITLWYGRIS